MSETLDILLVSGVIALAVGYLGYRKFKNRGKDPCCGCSSASSGDCASGCSPDNPTQLKDLRQ